MVVMAMAMMQPRIMKVVVWMCVVSVLLGLGLDFVFNFSISISEYSTTEVNWCIPVYLGLNKRHSQLKVGDSSVDMLDCSGGDEGSSCTFGICCCCGFRLPVDGWSIESMSEEI